MKRLTILSPLLGLGLLAIPAQASQPPADDGGGPQVQIKPLEPLAPVSAEAYHEASLFIVGIYGPIAQKIYYYYAPHQKYDLSYPYAPLSRIVATHAPGLSCYRRIPKFGVEQFRCNIAFDLSVPGGEQQTVPPYTYGLVPQFGDGKLQSLSLTLTRDEQQRYLLNAVECPRLSEWEFSGSNLPCAYQFNQGSVHDVYFPDDIFPQGVAVGWGIVQQ
jgi:hypothetical protein